MMSHKTDQVFSCECNTIAAAIKYITDHCDNIIQLFLIKTPELFKIIYTHLTYIHNGQISTFSIAKEELLPGELFSMLSVLGSDSTGTVFPTCSIAQATLSPL